MARTLSEREQLYVKAYGRLRELELKAQKVAEGKSNNSLAAPEERELAFLSKHRDTFRKAMRGQMTESDVLPATVEGRLINTMNRSPVSEAIATALVLGAETTLATAVIAGGVNLIHQLPLIQNAQEIQTLPASFMEGFSSVILNPNPLAAVDFLRQSMHQFTDETMLVGFVALVALNFINNKLHPGMHARALADFIEDKVTEVVSAIWEFLKNAAKGTFVENAIQQLAATIGHVTARPDGILANDASQNSAAQGSGSPSPQP